MQVPLKLLLLNNQEELFTHHQLTNAFHQDRCHGRLHYLVPNYQQWQRNRCIMLDIQYQYFFMAIDGDWVLYIPFGYHILSHNGMAFSIELGAKTPVHYDQDLKIYNFLGFGINFGFQF